MHSPDNWVIFKGQSSKGETIYKILAGWSGGYIHGDSWRINSGIVEIEEDEDFYYFKGYSNSVYRCWKDSECLRNNIAYVWNQLKEKFGDRVEKATMSQIRKSGIFEIKPFTEE